MTRISKDCFCGTSGRWRGFNRPFATIEEAIAKDPNYAPAYAGLANSYTLLTAYSAAPASEYMPKARAAAERALEIDERLPEAHVARALILANYDWDWTASEKEYRRGIQLNPNYATAHHWFAELLGWLGRFDEAQRESELARQLDPLSLAIATDRGAIFYYARQYDRAIEQFRAVEEMDPKFARAHIDHLFLSGTRKLSGGGRGPGRLEARMGRCR